MSGIFRHEIVRTQEFISMFPKGQPQYILERVTRELLGSFGTKEEALKAKQHWDEFEFLKRGISYEQT